VAGKRKQRKRGLTRHHRRPVHRGGKSDDRNISWVPDAKHKAYHLLFGVQLPDEVVLYLNILTQENAQKGNVSRYHYIALPKTMCADEKILRELVEEEVREASALWQQRTYQTLSLKKQKAFDLLFTVKRSPLIVAEVLTEIWIDPDWIIFAVPITPSLAA